jgi:hypothetical protein
MLDTNTGAKVPGGPLPEKSPRQKPKHRGHFGSGNNVPVRIANFDLAQIQLLHARLDLRAAADVPRSNRSQFRQHDPTV